MTTGERSDIDKRPQIPPHALLNSRKIIILPIVQRSIPEHRLSTLKRLRCAAPAEPLGSVRRLALPADLQAVPIVSWIAVN